MLGDRLRNPFTNRIGYLVRLLAVPVDLLDPCGRRVEQIHLGR